MAVVLSRAGAHGDMVLDHFSAAQLNSVVKDRDTLIEQSS